MSTERTGRLGEYDLLGMLGRGGMGTVYRARHRVLGAERALKVFDALWADPKKLERFQRETEALARVSHPNVARIHEVGQDQGVWFFTMDLIEGAPLANQLGVLPPEEVALVVAGVASGLEAIHAEGILHRDLKPANVVLRPDGTPVLLDLGLARHEDADALTRTGTLLGTPLYMSPEQAKGKGRAEVDQRTDVYGLGAVMFALLTGRPPFSGSEGQVATLVRVISQEPVWPRKGIPTPLEAVCRKAMAKDPADRYPAVRDLREDLQRFSRGESVEAPAPPRLRGSTPWLAIAVAVLILGVVGLGLTLPEDGPTPEVVDEPTSERGSDEPLDPRQVRRATQDWRVIKGLPDPKLYARAGEWLEANPRHPLREEVQVAREAAGTRFPRLRLPPDCTVARFLGQQVLAVYRGVIRLYDLHPRPREVRHWDQTGHVFASAMAVSPDGERFAVVSRHGNTRWVTEHPTRGGKKLRHLQLQGEVNYALAYSPREPLLAVSQNKQVLLWPFDRERPSRALRHGELVQSLAFSPDGKFLLTGSGGRHLARSLEQAVWRYDLRDDQVPPQRQAFAAAPTQMIWMPAGDRAIVGTAGGRIRFHDTGTLAKVSELHGEGSRGSEFEVSKRAHSSLVRGMRLLPDGRLVSISGSTTEPGVNELRVWDSHGKGVHAVLGLEQPMLDLDVDPTGRWALLSRGNGNVELWALPQQ